MVCLTHKIPDRLTIVPPTFLGNKLPSLTVEDENKKTIISLAEQLYLCSVWNSFVFDWAIRQKVTTTLNFFYLYQTPVPRLREVDPRFNSFVDRAARLICTTPEFDDLAKAVGLNPTTSAGRTEYGSTDPTERAKLRAELDGLVAHLYGLTEAEFAHILGSFPLVAEAVKVDAHNAYRRVANGLIE